MNENPSPGARQVVEVRNLQKVYQTGDTTLSVLYGLNLDVFKGEIAAVVGRSGSGKSTLLNLIGGLDSPSGGLVKINGRNVGSMNEEELSALRNRSIGFIFQFHYLLSEFSVMENVTMPYLIHAFDMKEAQDKAGELLRLLDIYDKRDYKPRRLSGGESQRVAIARSLINDPEIILADEPTGNLDAKTAEEVKNLLFGTTKRLGRTMIIVSHNKGIVDDADVVYQLAEGRLNLLIETYK